jgi:hypothetical protein
MAKAKEKTSYGNNVDKESIKLELKRRNSPGHY